ncbi:holo-ACP synthase [Treponema parvum]|uniref:Holo-[acyl-carrier-protein] synthase n=1 Tax=Treponema parvum TaxID=138851 RepID=A0A975IEN9_9SPIR|nr:holo-ACP synthase [Treponema parvum]QTQ11688.1 holo-ACP synthase [Treponema parvum]QTQ14146.1 holo-ACP synthase [Treponema parvum]
MIYGIGVDIVKIDRMKNWLKDPHLISRFFCDEEMHSGDKEFHGVKNFSSDGNSSGGEKSHRSGEGCASKDGDLRSENYLCRYYAVRFAAKEAFSKALGTGITGFALKDVFIKKNEEGKPFLCVRGKALDLLKKRCKNAEIFVTLSHEADYAVAFVVIEKRRNDDSVQKQA